MQSAPRVRRVPWQTLLIAALTIGLVAVFLRSIDVREAWRAVLAAHPTWILAATAVTLQFEVPGGFCRRDRGDALAASLD